MPTDDTTSPSMRKDATGSASTALPSGPVTLNYARSGEKPTDTDPFDRQMVGLFRYFIYLAVLLPLAAAMVGVVVMLVMS